MSDLDTLPAITTPDTEESTDTDPGCVAHIVKTEPGEAGWDQRGPEGEPGWSQRERSRPESRVEEPPGPLGCE